MLFTFLMTLLSAPAPVKQDLDRDEFAKVQGTWQIVTAEVSSRPWTKEQLEKAVLTLNGAKFNLADADRSVRGSLALNVKQSPKHFNGIAELSQNETIVAYGIYKLDKDTLTLCYNLKKSRPTEFRSLPESGTVLITARRQAGEKAPH